MPLDLIDSLVARHAPGSAPVVRLFGGPRVMCGQNRMEVPEGSKRLLVLLALHRAPVERRYASGVLWPAGSEERAAGNLRSALWRLNQANIDLVVSDKHRLSFRRGVLVDVELVADWARRLIAGRPAGDDLATLPRRTEAFELLPGWYDDWVLMERERIRQRVLHALEAMSRQLVAAGRYAEGVEAALLATCAEPLRESAQRVLLEAHLAEGNWVEGRRALNAYQALLLRELGIAPDPELAAMLAACRAARSGSGRQHRADRVARRAHRPPAARIATV